MIQQAQQLTKGCVRSSHLTFLGGGTAVAVESRFAAAESAVLV
jgi:hypothetical protein